MMIMVCCAPFFFPYVGQTLVEHPAVSLGCLVHPTSFTHEQVRTRVLPTSWRFVKGDICLPHVINQDITEKVYLINGKESDKRALKKLEALWKIFPKVIRY